MGLKDAHFNLLAGVTGTTIGTPLADSMQGGTISDTVHLSKYNAAYFCLLLGLSTDTTAAPVCTIVPINYIGGTTTTAIPFQYKLVATPDTNVGWVSASTYTVVTAHNQAIIFKVDADDLPLVSGVKYEYCYLNLTEPADDPQVGSCLIIMDEPRFAEDVTDTVTA